MEGDPLRWRSNKNLKLNNIYRGNDIKGSLESLESLEVSLKVLVC